MSTNKIFTYGSRFELESGKSLEGLEIAYQTFGKLNEDKSNVVWICHALTANADAEDWWPNVVGEGCLFDPSKHFIVCANILGSCYGTTGPLSINKVTGKPYLRDFPVITVRDIVSAHILLKDHLEIEKIHTLIGGSIGAEQALEWAIEEPEAVKHLIFIAANSKATSWNIAFSESQRLALEADVTFRNNEPDGGKDGLAAARSIALLSYRNDQTYNISQVEDDLDKFDDFKASSYQAYQGEKLVKRFNAYSYYYLTKVLDSHNVGRNRGGIKKALGQIKAHTLLMGITNDILFPAAGVKELQEDIKGSYYVDIESFYGHDGFLLEYKKITKLVNEFYAKTAPCTVCSK